MIWKHPQMIFETLTMILKRPKRFSNTRNDIQEFLFPLRNIEFCLFFAVRKRRFISTDNGDPPLPRNNNSSEFGRLCSKNFMCVFVTGSKSEKQCQEVR